MIRKAVTNFLFKKENRGILKIIGDICLIIGIIWSLFFLTLCSSGLFISENAFHPQTKIQSITRQEIPPSLITKTKSNLLPHSSSESLTISHILSVTSSLHLESHTQEYPIYTGNDTPLTGKNIITILRGSQSEGKECVLIAYKHNMNRFNISHHLGFANLDKKTHVLYGEVTAALSLMKFFSSQNWVSKDIIFLGYDGNFQYGKAVREFLDAYYERGYDMPRAGIIRQALAIDILNDQFNKWAIQIGRFLCVLFFNFVCGFFNFWIEGINGKLSDVDLFEMMRQSVSGIGYKSYEFDEIGLFRENKNFQKMEKFYNSIQKMQAYYLNKPRLFYFNPGTSILIMMDFFKNLIFGRYADAHPYLMEYIELKWQFFRYGIQACTLKGYKDDTLKPGDETTNIIEVLK